MYPTKADLNNFVHDFIKYNNQLHIGNTFQSQSLHWDEYFIIGMKSLQSSDFLRSKKWFKASIEKFDAMQHYNNIKILELISEIAVKNRDVDMALKAVGEILNVDRYHRAANDLKSLLESGNPDDMYLLKPDTHTYDDYTLSPEYKVYQDLCTNEISLSAANVRRLSCKYEFIDAPIAPVKVEDVSADPRIVLYHDIIYKSEFDSIQEKINFNVNIKRSNVFDNGNDVGSENTFRTSSEFHITRDDNHYFWNKISMKISRITNLRIEDEIGMTFIHYKESNQYAPHWDFYRNHEMLNFCNYTGNRIATVLIYVSCCYLHNLFLICRHFLINLWVQELQHYKALNTCFS